MTADDIKTQLAQVKYPGFSRDIVSFGLVRSVAFVEESGTAKVSLALTTSDPQVPLQIKTAVEQRLRELPGVRETIVDLAVTSVKPPAQAGGSSGAAGGNLAGGAQLPGGMAHAVAIASGKGGVGKSTVAVNLACAAAQVLAARQGRAWGGQNSPRVGLMDCDIYGPSIPLMMGLSGRPEIKGEGAGAMIIPMAHHGVKVMSMGFLVDDNTPVVWRGPMIMKTVQQFIQNVDWGELDLLLIDLPPGTGDAQLSLVQTIPLDGAILVTTPQVAATQVARKGGLMFQKVNVPLLGVTENMSDFVDSSGQHHALFGSGGGAVTAEQLGTVLLGKVPLLSAIREGGDIGQPIVVREPDGEVARLFRDMAEGLLDGLKKPRAAGNPA
ncbi:chromosome partitioning protein [Cephaloticoccus primus]|uniref:Iron-sulfur cluster carrier protein n=1 Tax=Cephaloticoccus primus TaxID=1548207 RepID=A0A139SSM7_9BACT|nr:P-loop NTPase [Cephaloticoccus primus]KXU37588.1 chromosome partitioning protein [Cephaloticoccus primus]